MTVIEKRIIDFLKKHSTPIFLFVVTIIGLIVRYNCRDYVSGDARYFLLQWYDDIKTQGIHGLSHQTGDYNIPYQFIIFLFTNLPIKPLYAYKILSVLFDFALAFVGGLLIFDADYLLSDILNSNRFAMAYSAILLCPTVFLNSACWAQCDSIYAFFVLASLYAFSKEKNSVALILFGLAFAFKFQTIFALPFVLILYVVEKKFSLVKLIWIPIVLIVSSLPGIIMGRSIWDPFKIYFKQTSTYSAISLNYNSFWNCLIKSWPGISDDYKEFKTVAVCVTACILGMIVLYVIKRDVPMDSYSRMLLFHISIYTCVLFLPTMHERYGYIYEISAILLVFMNKRLLFPCLGVILLSCMTYGYYLFGVEYSSLTMSLINVFLWAGYAYTFISNAGESRNVEMSFVGSDGGVKK